MTGKNVESMKSKTIGVVMGGPGSERAVSLETGKGVVAALGSLGYNVVPIEWKTGASLPALLMDAKVEVVWNALHGTYGEDGAVQGLLTCMGIPYTGSDILSSALAMDKLASKRMFVSHGIATPRWQIWQPDCSVELAYPLVVKPSKEGSSVGVSLVATENELQPAVAKASQYAGPILVEEYIAGSEVFVGILGQEALGTIEVRTAADFYDYDAKYVRGDTQYIVPAPFPQSQIETLEELGLAAHRALGCTSYSRVDIRVRDDGEPFVLEVNTLPGMTNSSLMPKLAKKVGISYAQLCERILLK